MLLHPMHSGPSRTTTRPLLAVAMGVVFEEWACKARPRLGVFGRGGDGDTAFFGIVFVGVVRRETFV
jgi:hypothetical protein